MSDAPQTNLDERTDDDHAANISFIASACWTNYALAFQRVMFGVSAAAAVAGLADFAQAMLAK